jgi:trehalose synthase
MQRTLRSSPTDWAVRAWSEHVVGQRTTGGANPICEGVGSFDNAVGVIAPRDIEVPTMPVTRLRRVIGHERVEALLESATELEGLIGGARVWNISSTATGGGVAEMLRLLIAYADDAGVDTRWIVIGGDERFFAITKRLHNRLHGVPGDGGSLGAGEADHYAAVLHENAAKLDGRIRPGDVVFLHDPQTAGLAGPLVERGVHVVWRCHIGTDRSNQFTEEGWAFLASHLAACHTFVFSHAGFVPASLAGSDLWIIAPSIDPLSPKNRPLRPAQVEKLLRRTGLVGGDVLARPCVLGGAGPFSSDAPVVVQVSRWDRLKDMAGVLRGFADHLAARSPCQLALVGPAAEGVSDDPEGAQVLAECLDAWHALPAATRNAIRLVALPMEDVRANSLLVNAIQRHASIVVQKSLQEGFGLTVTEAMWKARPVVASAVGGIVDQVAPGTGLLLTDPEDLDAFAAAVGGLLDQPKEMKSIGRRARLRVRTHFLCDRHLIEFGRLVAHAASGSPATRRVWGGRDAERSPMTRRPSTVDLVGH